MAKAADASRRNSELKRRILVSGRAILMTSGYSGFNMDNLALELGLSKKTLYALFSGKRELAAEIADATIVAWNAELEAALGKKYKNFPLKLQATALFIFEKYNLVPNNLLADLKRYAPELWRKVYDWKKEIISTQFGRLYDEGVAAGFFSPKVNKKIAIDCYCAAEAALLSPEYLSASKLQPKKIQEEIFRIMLYGIASGPKLKKSLHPEDAYE
ncbi:MAG: TetR/AcrR family transcriptional regulator [Elusimicrobiaceae bacterium]|jgi:AcrR family transcriptional regulator